MPEPDLQFSNPLPPSSRGRVYDDDEYDAHPLTNDDFRKLMMTPRATPGATPSSAPPSTQRQNSATFATPKPVIEDNDPSSLRRKKKSYYAQLKKEEEEREKELAQKYRDRAKERREGGNKDYEAAGPETGSTTADYKAVAPTAKLGEDYAEKRKKLIQESKYLGGDMEHTHLVKGLDYALLEKVKAEISNKEQEEEHMEEVVVAKPDKEAPVSENPEDLMQFKTKLGRSIYRSVFSAKPPDRNDLFLPGRMAYVVDLEEEYGDLDVPTTLIRSKADCPSLESTTTLTNNDIVINKLTQILSYLRQGRRDRKKKKGKGTQGMKEDERIKALAMDIYAGLGNDLPSYSRTKNESSKAREDRRDNRREEKNRERRDERSDRRRDDARNKRSYFEKPVEEEDEYRGGDRSKLPTNAKDLVMSINNRFGGGESKGGWEAEGGEEKSGREDERLKKLKSKNEIDSYAECYPGMMESADAIDDSDDEADYTKMDQGNKKGPVGRWDFDTPEEYSSYMSNREALPKAAFQYGVKMSDGRKTRRAGPKDERKELDKEWQKIQNIISVRKRKGDDDGPSSKR